MGEATCAGERFQLRVLFTLEFHEQSLQSRLILVEVSGEPESR